VLPLLVVDFNMDRFNDIILVSRDGVFGYAQVRSVGSVPFSALVACMIVAMTAVYITQQGPGTKRKKGRSTERLD